MKRLMLLLSQSLMMVNGIAAANHAVADSTVTEVSDGIIITYHNDVLQSSLDSSNVFNLWTDSVQTGLLNVPEIEPFVLDTTKHVGKIPVTESVSASGGRIYAVPVSAISDSPFVPGISLNYNSQGGIGVAGYGWTLGGLSAITVIPKSEFYHDTTSAINYADTSSVYCLDGVPLLASTKYQKSDEFQLETAQGHIIVKRHSENGSTKYFTALYPNGSRAVFGFENFTPNNHTFPLTTITDIRDNVIDYEYRQCGNQTGNNFVVTSIKYGHRTGGVYESELIFEYEDLMPSVARYYAGIPKMWNQLLKTISVMNKGQEVMKYVLTHTDKNGAKLLTQIDCCCQEASLNPVRFYYGSSSVAATEGFVRGSSGIMTHYFDNDSDVELDFLRGKFSKNSYDDGLLIVPRFETYTVMETYEKKFLGQVVSVNYKVGSRYEKEQAIFVVKDIGAYCTVDTLHAGTGFQGVWPADINGDGQDEILKLNIHDVNANYTKLRLTTYKYKDNGRLSRTTKYISLEGSISDSKYGYNPVKPHFFFGDFLGSGKQQMLIMSDANDYLGRSRTTKAMLVELDAGGSTSRFDATDVSPKHSFEYFAADIDNDGLTELCHLTQSLALYTFQFDGSKLTLDRSYNVGSIGSITPEDKREGVKVYFTDFNGDGYMDVVSAPTESYYYDHVTESDLPDEDDYVVRLYQDNGDQWEVYCFTGEGFVRQQMNICNYDRGDEYIFMDVNKDGLSDMVQRKGSHTNVYLNQDGILSSEYVETPFPVRSTAHLLPANVRDYNRISDFIIVDSYSIGSLIYNRDVSKERLITRFTDSYGVTTYNSYEDATDGGVCFDDDRDYDEDNGFMRRLFPLNVLRASTTYSTPDKNNSMQLQNMSYLYYDPVLNSKGLGFCGFGKTKVTDINAGTVSVSMCSPETFGAEIYKSTSLMSSETIPFTTVENTYGIPDDALGKFNPRLEHSTQCDSLTGNMISTTYEYDKYGFPMKVSAKYYSLDNTAYSYVINSALNHYILSEDRYVLNLPAMQLSVTHDSDTSKTVFGTRVNYHYNDTTVLLTSKEVYKTSGAKGFYLAVPPSDGEEITETAVGDSIFRLDYKAYLQAETLYEYDAFGNIISEKTAQYGTSGYVGDTYTYDDRGRQMVSSTDPLGRTTLYSDYNIFGQAGKKTNHKGHVTAIEYDEWGNPVKTAFPDGRIERISRDWGGIGTFTETFTSTGNPGQTVHYDMLGREIRSESQRFDGSWQKIDKEYDINGLVLRESVPFKGSSASLWNTYEYDAYSRPVSVTSPGAGSMTWTYDGNSVVEIKNGIAKRVYKDALGNVIAVADAGSQMIYDYRTDGQPISVTAFGRIVTSFEYDEFGRRSSIWDASAGTQIDSVSYNDDGSHSRTQVLQNGTVVSSYDAYGRLTGVNRLGEYSTGYAYDNDGNLYRERSTNGTAKYYKYDEYDRVVSLREVVPDNHWLLTEYTYGEDGNLAAAAYSSDSGTICTETYGYRNGIQTSIDIGNERFFELEAENVKGQPTRARTLSATRLYAYDTGGRPAERRFIMGGDSQYFLYNFDAATGNLLARRNEVRQVEDEFAYDALNRLIKENGRPRYYDASGNLLEESGLVSCTYANSSRPFQITEAQIGAENMYTTGQNVNYTCYGRPARIVENGYAASFTYNGDGDRVKMLVAKGTAQQQVNYYIGGRYEIESTASGQIERFYIGGDFYSAPMVYVRSGSTWTPYEIFRDHLGSITGIAKPDGTLVAEYSYDAWGRMRNPATNECYAPGEEPDLFLGRGYTGHEHLPWFNLINMNARLYDPVLGRFLSPDPFVQMPDFTQNFNRYSYCLNNPLVYVDENGEFWHIVAGAVIGGIMNIIANRDYIDNAGEFFASLFIGAGTGAINALTGGVLSSVITSGINDAANGIIQQLGTTASNWGELDWGLVGKNALYGGVMAGVSGVFSKALGATSLVDDALDNLGIENLSARNIVGSTIEGGIVGTATGVVSGVAQGALYGDSNVFANAYWGALYGAAGGFASGAITEIAYQAQLKHGRSNGLNSDMNNTLAKAGNDFILQEKPSPNIAPGSGNSYNYSIGSIVVTYYRTIGKTSVQFNVPNDSPMTPPAPYWVP